MKDEYQPFMDDGEAPLEVTKWPKRKPVPDTVRKWDEETSVSTGNVQTDGDAATKET